MRAITVTASLILGSFKFGQCSAVPSSLPWHMRGNCDERLEPLKISHSQCLKESRGRVVKHNPSVMGVIVFSVIAADLLILLASDLEVWTVALIPSPFRSVSKTKGFRWLSLHKTLSYLRERCKCNHALTMMYNGREDSERGTVLSSTAGWCVLMRPETLGDVGGTFSGTNC